MSETRPVPRRESPWGLPEGHREPKAHRCNDRVEDVVQVLTIFFLCFDFFFFPSDKPQKFSEINLGFFKGSVTYHNVG